MRCQGLCSNGKRCRRRDKGSLCWQHQKEDFHGIEEIKAQVRIKAAKAAAAVERAKLDLRKKVDGLEAHIDEMKEKFSDSKFARRIDKAERQLRDLSESAAKGLAQLHAPRKYVLAKAAYDIENGDHGTAAADVAAHVLQSVDPTNGMTYSYLNAKAQKLRKKLLPTAEEIADKENASVGDEVEHATMTDDHRGAADAFFSMFKGKGQEKARWAYVSPKSQLELLEHLRDAREVGGYFTFQKNKDGSIEMHAVTHVGSKESVSIKRAVVEFHTHPEGIMPGATGRDLANILMGSRIGVVAHMLYTVQGVYTIGVSPKLAQLSMGDAQKLADKWSRLKNPVNLEGARKLGFRVHHTALSELPHIVMRHVPTNPIV